MSVAKLVLEDGSVFEGRSFGAAGERQGEVVFNTAMMGYQEVLTDPSYTGQIVTMTCAHVGNTGVNEEDHESDRPWVEGFVAREFSSISSSPRATGRLEEFLKRHEVVAIDNVDTRALTRRLRQAGSMNGVISTVDLDEARLLEKARAVPSMGGLDLVQRVTSDRVRSWASSAGAGGKDRTYRVGLIDCGVKANIIRSLLGAGCDVTVHPATATVADLEGYDGVCISNGPGDPAAVTYAVETVRGLLRKEVPLLGICLGHQILGLALGARTYKLKFGHHGANHPVLNRTLGRVEITSQNHGFAVDEKSLEAAGGQVTRVNLNDGSVEGLGHRSLPCLSVQYHPEASPGPHDARSLFADFVALLGQA